MIGELVVGSSKEAFVDNPIEDVVVGKQIEELVGRWTLAFVGSLIGASAGSCLVAFVGN